ncbi:MAG: hypothetical protein LJF06_05005 [Gemmatimonadetes bacterium]|nr:hypothetical protein [Gemmatimonadota bacterium]
MGEEGDGPGGAALEQTSFPYTVINIYFPQFQVEPGGIVLWARAPMGTLKGDQPRLDRLLRASAEGDSVPLLPPLPSHVGTAHFDACGVTVTMRVPLSPFPRWSQWGNRVAVTDWPEYSVDILDADRLVERIRADDAGPTLDAAGAARLLEGQGLEGGPCPLVALRDSLDVELLGIMRLTGR